MGKRGRPSRRDQFLTANQDNNAPQKKTNPKEAAAVIDKSLIDAPAQAPIPAAISREPAAGYRAFKCYLGHLTYTAQKVESIVCLYCNAAAKPLSGTEVCLCSHKLTVHNPHCAQCGIMEDGDGGPEPRCAKFVMSS